MATMTRKNLAETIKARLDLVAQTEYLRIESGIRDPENWSRKKRAVCRGRHSIAFCYGCYEPIDPDTPMVWQEDINCYVEAHRHRYWHPECHPDAINREFERLRKHWSQLVEHRTTCP